LEQILLETRLSKYFLHQPKPKQLAFLALQCEEAFFGGAAGGGKSDALLMGALQYVDTPGYHALLLRRTYADLALPEALMSRAQEWLRKTDAHWSSTEKTWSFPSGATVSFGYLATEGDMYRYQSSAYQYIAFDELTQFTETQYRYLFSRLRRLYGVDIPLRMRAASNPGGVGHDWVKQRFITEGLESGRIFVPSSLRDMEDVMDTESYRQSLNNLDPVTREQLLNGDWTARESGGVLRREWFRFMEEAPVECRRVRFWDLAATAPDRKKDPDWTVGVLLGVHNGIYYIEDVQRMRGTPYDVEALVKQTSFVDQQRGHVSVRMEQEPGASGVATIDHYSRTVLIGKDFLGRLPSGPKEERVRPVSSAAEAGNMRIVDGHWIIDFLDEADAFPNGSHDDQVDALSGAFSELANSSQGIGLYM
jgi:predicted phage terminase large subunit-like protein